MDKTQFIAGIFDKYPERILENRITIEGNVIGALWADPISLDEYELKASDFITKDGRFFFKIARMLRTQYKLNEFDEAAVITHLTEELREDLDDRGGYREIKNLVDITSTKNIMVYVDELNKSNLILKLYKSGFSLLTPIEDMNGKEVIAYDQIKKLDYQGALEWWEAILSTFANNSNANSSILEEKTQFTITDEMISEFEEGQMVGTSFGYIDDTDVNGNPIRVMPFLDAEVCSLRHGTTTALCGYSSVGKSMLLCGILLALVSHGEKVCIISNEMNSTPYMLNFLCFLAYRKFRYNKLTRSKLQTGEMSDEDKAVLKKTQKYFNDNFANDIMFYHISDADTSMLKRVLRRAHLMGGATVMMYDTMKAQLNDYNDDKPAYLSLIRDSREIDLAMKKFDMIGLISLQISSATKGRTWIDESCISQSKQLIEIMENCWMMRNLYGPQELTPGDKYYLNPFRRVKNKQTGQWEKEQFLTDPNSNYKLLYITKNRAGKNSENSSEILLLKADTHLAVFHEEAWAKGVRGYIGAN